MRLANMTWPQAEKYFKQNDTVLLSVGSIECHGRHLPLGTDTLIPEKLLDDVSEDFECPCWRVTIPDADYEPTERCFYYADVFVGEDMRVLRIERNKDIFLTNYLIACFPRPLEMLKFTAEPLLNSSVRAPLKKVRG